MTITYSLDVADTRFFGFTKLLGRWKGSIYKILWKEFAVFIFGYSLLSITYRYSLNEHQKKMFENVVMYFEAFIDLIPLSFVLGFYVSLVVGRWWEQFDAIPWPDRLCYLITTYVHGADERSRTIRRTLGRYLILMQALTFQSVSTAVKRRFPTTHHFVMAGFMTKEERTVFENVEAPYGKWWLPAQWFCALAMRARKEGRIKDSILLNGLLEEFLKYRSTCGTMFNYDWISVPLVYTQVVTLATYTYSVALMVGRQYLDPAKNYKNHAVDLYVPLFTLLQFFFYVGWLKVAEQIVNPYGEDDDDFELNWCLDRSCHVVYMLVDHFHTKHPKLRRDPFWDQLLPELPQTKITAKNVNNPQLGSAFNLEVNPADSEFLSADTLLEEDNDANMYNSVKQSGNGVRYRPSFLMSILNSNFGQSMRKRSSVHKAESFRDVQGHANPAFVRSVEKYTPYNKSSSPTNSRSSSLAKIRPSPTHSRASSLSFQPAAVRHNHRHRSFDVPHAEPTGVSPDCFDGSGATSAAVVSDFEAAGDKTDSMLETDVGIPKMESYMPSIPEEPSRIVSAASLESSGGCHLDSGQLDNVQTLVAEASKVLEELNKAVREGRHKKDCESKGYESCCSLSSSDEDEEEDDTPETDETGSIAVEMPRDHQGDTERNF